MTFSANTVLGMHPLSMRETMAFLTFRDVAMSIGMTADTGHCSVFAGIGDHFFVHILVTGAAIF